MRRNDRRRNAPRVLVNMAVMTFVLLLLQGSADLKAKEARRINATSTISPAKFPRPTEGSKRNNQLGFGKSSPEVDLHTTTHPVRVTQTTNQRWTTPIVNKSSEVPAKNASLHCLPHEFRCGEEECIDEVKLCDTVVDCQDATDEDAHFCRSHNCPISHFKCNDGYCIPIGQICDYKPNCPDGSDEQNCNYRKCWHGEWECTNHQCINEVFLCDGQTDCKDNSDEENCQAEAFLGCDHQKVVHRSMQCDGKADCKDQTDETDCGKCKANQFQCYNGRCIPNAHVCDSHCDCLTCEDEHETNRCNEFYEGTPGLAFCRKHRTIHCNKTSRCVHREYICDGKDDCLDGGTDEFQCNLNHSHPAQTTPQTGVTCSDGRTLPAFAKCDYRRHCLLGEDERTCPAPPCSPDQFRCHSGQCISQLDVCNAEPNCRDGSDEFFCTNFTCPEGTFKCHQSGHCVPLSKICDHRLDCPLDGSDEPESCPYRHHKCKDHEFRCKNGQCINHQHVCQVSHESALYGCLDASHLQNCSSAICNGITWLKCRNGPCYHFSLQCNGLPDCYKGSHTWTDEEGCPFQCSNTKKCICMDVTMECINGRLPRLPTFVEPSITKFVFAGNRLGESLGNETFTSLHRLTLLDLADNELTLLPGRPFRSLWQLRVLILKNNQIRSIQRDTFFGLANVRVLDLTSNGINNMEGFAFNGLSTLPQLDLSNQKLRHIPANAFVGLRNLLSLNLSGNPIKTIDPAAFFGLNYLVTLDISNTGVEWALVDYPAVAFYSLFSLTNFYTSDARFCCSIGAEVANCFPKVDHFSSCSDLMSNIVLRTMIWIMGTVALFANAVVVYWRFPDLKRSRIHAFLIINLAVGDFIMGIYLLVIAGADMHYRGSYVYHFHEWKRSHACSAAGFLSTVSSELSILTLLVITIDRLLTILLPFNLDIRLTFSSAAISMSCIWFFVLLIAFVPLLPLPYFDNFYGRSGVCLALHITPERFPGWEYSIFIFLILNMLACLLIILAYAGMYAVALRTQRAVQPASQNRKESRLARRMVLIILTNLSCFLPISILSVLALTDIAIPEETYSWVAVFMLPVNAALNPLLYTMSTGPFRRNVRTSLTYRAQHLRESLLASINSSTRRRTSTSTQSSQQGHLQRGDRTLKYEVREPLPEE